MLRQFLYLKKKILIHINNIMSLSQRPRGLRRWSVAARLLRLWVRITPGVWMFICCVLCFVR